MTKVHNPRLDTMLMIEETIKKHSGEYGKFQLWKKLPKSVMYQTYLLTLNYLEESKKIALDKNKKVGWIFNTKLYKQYQNQLKR